MKRLQDLDSFTKVFCINGVLRRLIKKHATLYALSSVSDLRKEVYFNESVYYKKEWSYRVGMLYVIIRDGCGGCTKQDITRAYVESANCVFEEGKYAY